MRRNMKTSPSETEEYEEAEYEDDYEDEYFS